jgi:hypothetical protein
MPVTTRSGSANNNPIIVGMAAATASAIEEGVEISTTANAPGAVKSVASIALQLSEAVTADITSTKRNIVRVVIPNKNFTSEDLSKCIQQVIITAYSSDDTLLLDRIGYLSGLYLKSDSTFVPFSHIISHIDSYTQDTFCFKLPSTISTTKCFDIGSIFIHCFSSFLDQYWEGIAYFITVARWGLFLD